MKIWGADKTSHSVTLSCALGYLNGYLFSDVLKNKLFISSYLKKIISRLNKRQVKKMFFKRIEPSVLNFQCGFAQMKSKYIVTSTWLCYSKATNKSCLGLHSLSPQICWPLRLQRDIQKLELLASCDSQNTYFYCT